MNFADLVFRKAEEKDLKKILNLLADDILGKNREDLEKFSVYHEAFLAIDKNNNDFLAVVEFEGEVIATIHLTLMNLLTRKAAKRLNIEAVRVDSKYLGQGIGSWMIKKAIEFGRVNDAKIIQLTTDKTRIDAQRFYQRLGFKASHEGMKLYL